MSLQQLRETCTLTRVLADGHEIDIVATRGTGVPLMLLPGAQGTAEIFYRQLLAWGDQRRMVAVTYPGLTDALALADLLVHVADALQLPGFDIIGSSYGAYLAQWMAHRHASRVGRLVIGNSFQDPGPARSADKLAALQAAAPEPLQADALQRLQAAADPEFRAVMLELVGQRQPAQMLRSRMIAVQMADPVPPLPVPDQRLLLIECDNDPLIPAPRREALRRHYPGARHCCIEGGGHYPYILKPEAYNAAVASFLDLV